MKKNPPVSIIIVTLNASRTLVDCLRYIKNQTYKKVDEVLIVDGGSTDNTFQIAKKSGLPIRIIHGKYKNNQEARRAVGVGKAKNEICIFLDSDNYITNKNWISDMIQPLLIHENVIASQTLRYAVPKKSTLFNRYFGLLGASDPVAYYLGKDDRLSWAFDEWNLLGKVILRKKNYILVDFDPENYPTLGCNGIAFRKSILLKAKWRDPSEYIHTDVFVDVGRLGYTTFAIVKNDIFHNTAENMFNFMDKRRRYMKFYHQVLNKKRRHLTFDVNRKKDVLKLFLFIVFALTFVEPLLQSFRGYLKKRDVAWFLHPLLCVGMIFIYGESTIARFLKKT